MCTVMVLDKNRITRDWVRECIIESDIKASRIVYCSSYKDAESFIDNNTADIIFTHIDNESTMNVDFIESLQSRLLFSIICGYGTFSNFSILSNLLNCGVKKYLKDVFDKEKLNTFFNEAYEHYCYNKLMIKSLVENESNEKYGSFDDSRLKYWVRAFNYCAELKGEEQIAKYIEFLEDIVETQSLRTSKAIILELIILISELATGEVIKTDYAFFNPKECRKLVSCNDEKELKGFINRYFVNLAANIYMNSKNCNYKKQMIKSAVKYIKNNFMKSITRDEVASAVSLNPCYFSQFFKEQTGESFVSYLRKIRLEEAKKILEDTNISIKTVSQRVGYPNSRYFTKLFHNYTGFTPCDYRKISCS